MLAVWGAMCDLSWHPQRDREEGASQMPGTDGGQELEGHAEVQPSRNWRQAGGMGTRRGLEDSPCKLYPAVAAEAKSPPLAPGPAQEACPAARSVFKSSLHAQAWFPPAERLRGCKAPQLLPLLVSLEPSALRYPECPAPGRR